MNNKGQAQALILIPLIIIFALIFLGGFGTFFTIIKGITSIPPFAYLIGAVIIILILFRSNK